MLEDAVGSYDNICTYSFDPDDGAARQPSIGRRDPRHCRFCNDARRPLTFHQEAHVIPAALGNRRLFSWEECDGCNARGSQYEDALCKQLSLLRAMSRIDGRAGAPKHRFGSYPSFVQSDKGNNRVIVSRTQGDQTLKIRRLAEGLRYIVRIPKYRPLDVAKAIARMAYFVLPDVELPRAEHIRRWLRDEENWLAPIFHGFVPGPGLRYITLNVERRTVSDDGLMPLYRVFFAFSTAVYALHIPDDGWVLPANITLPDLGRSPYPPHDVKWNRTRLLQDGEQPPYDEHVDVAVPALRGVPLVPEATIREAAHARWEARGRGDGRALDDWLEAEEGLLVDQLRAHSAQVPVEDDPL